MYTMELSVSNNGILYNCTVSDSQKDIRLPNNIEAVWFDAFNECTHVERIFLNDGLRYIKGGAFLGCTALKNIFIPKSVTKIHVFDYQYIENCQAMGCKGGFSEFRNSSNSFKVIGYKNSFAEKYCEHFEIEFEVVE